MFSIESQSPNFLLPRRQKISTSEAESAGVYNRSNLDQHLLIKKSVFIRIFAKIL